MSQVSPSPYADIAVGITPDTGKRTLADTVYDRMRWDIVRGELPPGMPLRLEQLKDRYSAGFSPLREALNRLQGERLVVSQSLRGFVVAPLSRDEMNDAIDARILVEGEALQRAIRNGGDAWEAEILAAAHELTKSLRRASDGFDVDMTDLERRHRRFHHALIAACGSTRLLRMADTLYMETERYRLTALHRSVDLGERDVCTEHEALVRAVLARDEDAAAALLTEHYRDTGRQMESVLTA
ncbi:FCD domain-containing protein [Rhodospirillaceae bacterium KN72]|uniref:FCD domain-containing protein n=1 Tax=Pacificispira spongiicola TaxID=2729598 RepID=A0A7Y0DWH4_9PROT|nr:FCD domain-containing protein [Pacificispira spongiicola]NMM42867.1 FCD domain-containing protein [Pacificispira spongiicola]